MENLFAGQEDLELIQERPPGHRPLESFDIDSLAHPEGMDLPTHFGASQIPNSDRPSPQRVGHSSFLSNNYGVPVIYPSAESDVPLGGPEAIRDGIRSGNIHLQDPIRFGISNEEVQGYGFTGSPSYPIKALPSNEADGFNVPYHQLITSPSLAQFSRTMMPQIQMATPTFRTRYHPAGYSIGSLQHSGYGQYISAQAPSSYTATNHQYHQPHQLMNPYVLQSNQYLPAVSQYPSGSYMLRGVPYMDSAYSLTSGVGGQLPVFHQSNYVYPRDAPPVLPYLDPAIASSGAEDIQPWGYPVQSQAREVALSSPTYSTDLSIPWSVQLGTGIVRTASPEAILNEGTLPGGGCVEDTNSSSPIRARRPAPPQYGGASTVSLGLVSMELNSGSGSGSGSSSSSGSGSVGSGANVGLADTSTSRSSSSSSDFLVPDSLSSSWECIPPVTKNPSEQKVTKKQRTRTQTEAGILKARQIRYENGVCLPCRFWKRPCSVDGCCPRCSQETLPGLGYFLCYRRDFCKRLSCLPDVFGIEHRQASIKADLKSMHGIKKTLRLGNGMDFRNNVISINIDESNIMVVEIQKTNPRVSQPWISSESKLLVKPGLMKNLATKSYAIVPNTEPSISEMDNWGRRSIEASTTTKPLDIAANYDLVLLSYPKIEPPQPCHEIVEITLKILSLGKFLDDRRPVDHDAVFGIVTSLMKDLPTNFGIKDFNKCKPTFQLSTTASQQLYVRAAAEIVQLLAALGHEIDNYFTDIKMDNAVNVFVVGVCLLRLGLEYRQRLERYRSFHADFDQLTERMRGCYFMYKLFTNLYGYWYRFPNRIPPSSPKWDIVELECTFSHDPDLVDKLPYFCDLEMEFCKKLKADHKLYESIITKRELKRSSRE